MLDNSQEEGSALALETNLRLMGRHLVDTLELHRLEITTADSNEPAFAKAVYGEPRQISMWPLLSVQPQAKVRGLKATRKFIIDFNIWLIIYHGQVATTLDLQEGAHKRIEAVEGFVMTDFKWNFVDSTDKDLDKVIFGFPSVTDHPVVIAPEEELWSSSRMELKATSEEYF